MMNEQEATKFKDGGVLGLDDTFLIHYGKSFDQIALLHDHSTKQYIWVHNLVNLHYSDDQIDYPAYFELWQPLEVEALEKVLRELKAIKPKKEILKESNSKKWKQHLLYLSKKKQYENHPDVQQAYRSKLVIGKDLLRKFFDKYPDLNISISFDKWFTSSKFCKFVDKELDRAYVAGIARYDSALLNNLQTQLDTDIESSLAYWRRTTQAQALWMLVQWMARNHASATTLF